MSNVIRLCDRKRQVCTVAPEFGIDGFQSLFESWRSITLNFETLQDYLDQLRPVLDALPESPEKSHANLLLKEVEVQIRDCHIRSIGANANVARALVTRLRPSG